MTTPRQGRPTEGRKSVNIRMFAAEVHKLDAERTTTPRGEWIALQLQALADLRCELAVVRAQLRVAKIQSKLSTNTQTESRSIHDPSSERFHALHSEAGKRWQAWGWNDGSRAWYHTGYHDGYGCLSVQSTHDTAMLAIDRAKRKNID